MEKQCFFVCLFVCYSSKGLIIYTQAQCFKNLSAVLEEAGSSMKNVVRVGVFLTDMTNFAAMNKVYETFFEDPKPACSLMSSP